MKLEITSPLALTIERFSITVTAIRDVKKDLFLVSVSTLLRCYPAGVLNTGQYSNFKE